MPSFHLSEVCSNHTHQMECFTYLSDICHISSWERVHQQHLERRSLFKTKLGGWLSITYKCASQTFFTACYVSWWGLLLMIKVTIDTGTATSQAASPQRCLIKLVTSRKKTFVSIFAFLLMRKCSLFINLSTMQYPCCSPVYKVTVASCFCDNVTLSQSSRLLLLTGI